MKFREVSADDIDIIFEWANDPVTRKQSYSINEILYKEHKKWFHNKLNDEECHFLLFMIDKEPIGFVRFDQEGGHWIVSINVAPAQRGEGYSSRMLKEAILYIKAENYKPVYAYIKQNNIASVKAFKKAGFNKESDLIYKDIKSFLFVWK